MRIGIDIMGGDFAPEKTIKGAILAQNELQESAEIVLFGKKSIILDQLEKNNYTKNNFRIVDCNEVIEMGDHPTRAFKTKSQSSIAKGFQYLANGEINGFCSAGNTGAMFVGGFYSVKSISGVLRPCIAALLPKENGGNCVLLDVGANADCKADVLYQFGLLGSLFAKYVCKIEKPKVALLNIGEEKTKGSMLSQSAYQIMEGTKEYCFIGNLESYNIFDGEADVIVCDGFTGNIVLKQAEGFYQMLLKRNMLDDYFEKFNYENYGGTPVLGLNKSVVIGHGISNEIAIKNMISLTRDIEKAKLSSKIKNNLN